MDIKIESQWIIDINRSADIIADFNEMLNAAIESGDLETINLSITNAGSACTEYVKLLKEYQSERTK